MSKKKLIVTGAAGLALITAGALPAFAAAHQAVHQNRYGIAQGLGVATNGRVVGGTIATISGDTLTLTPRTSPHATTTPATVAVNTTDATAIMKDGQKATLADLAAGEMAIVSGVRTSDTSIEASRILVRTKAKAFGWLRRK